MRTPESVVPDRAVPSATKPTATDSDLEPNAVVPSPTSTSPRSLGRYRVMRELGRGGMGVVLEAYDPSLDRKVALKLLSSERGERHARRQLREARALARLSHPHVVGVYEAGTVDGRNYIAMELVEGESLAQWHHTPRPWREVLDAYLQAGRGLAAAHDQGLVHRDFKPSNCLIDAEGRVKVADFGLASDAEELRRRSHGDSSERPEDDEPEPPPPEPDPAGPFSERLTRPGTVLGTLAYMAPEQRSGAAASPSSDQYSYCASIVEALGIATDGTISPRAPRIPRALHEVLTRGMALDEQRRWPTMAALLRALERCRRPRARQRWAVALLSINLGLIAALWWGTTSAPSPCEGSRERLHGVWDDERARDVEQAILGTRLSYARDTNDAVQARLSRYADAWVRMHTEACEAAHIHGELSPVALDRRMSCLDGRRTALRHAVEQLAEADEEVVEQAVHVTTGLPALDRCAEPEALRSDPRPPPELADAVTSLRADLDRARTRLQAGKYDEGLREADAAMTHAESIGYEPAEAEARSIRGALHLALGHYPDAESDLRRARALALRLDHAEVAAEASTSLAFVIGVPQSRYESAMLVGESAVALAQRIDSGGPREAEAHLCLAQLVAQHGDDEDAEGRFERALELLRSRPESDPLDLVGALDGLRGVLRRRGRHREAERLAREAVALVERDLGAEHPAIVLRLANLAAVLMDQGRHEDAEAELRRALAVGEVALREGHPTLAHVHANLGAVLLMRGRHDDAALELERALEIHRGAPAPAADQIADVLANLGVTARGRGNADEAEAYYREALSRYAEVFDEQHPKVAMVELNLGKTLHVLGRADEAAVHLERARAGFESYGGPEHAGVGKALAALGLLDFERGRLEQAHAHQVRALEIFQHAYPDLPSHPRVARALWALGRTELQLDQLQSAEEHLERAHQMQLAADTRAVDRANTELSLARLRWRHPDERERALALAREALARVSDEGGDAAAKLRDELRAWLAAPA